MKLVGLIYKTTDTPPIAKLQ